MKKLFVAILLLSLMFSTVACSSNAPSDTGSVGSSTENKSAENNNTQKTEFAIGETWTVEGQWSLTVNSVTLTDARNEYADTNPAAVYIIDYTYTNIGYKDQSGIMDGLFFGMDDTIVDSAGIMGYSYPGDLVKNPQETPIGATCNAQACIGVDNAGTFKIVVNQYDGNSIEQSATFIVAP